MTAANRKQAERQRRKDAGEVRVEVWLSPESIEDLRWIHGLRMSRSEAVSRALRFYRNPS